MSIYAPYLLPTLVASVALCLGWGAHAAVLVRQLARARRDPLTGLYLRGPFVARAARCVRRRTVVCGLIDVDDFKGVNDTYGHATGDAVLRALAHRVRHALPRHAVAGRWGGDELALVLPVKHAAALIAALREPVCVQVPHRGAVQVEISVGWSAPVRGNRGAAEAMLDSALAEADTVMYAHKPRRGAAPAPRSPRKEQRRIHRALARPAR